MGFLNRIFKPSHDGPSAAHARPGWDFTGGPHGKGSAVQVDTAAAPPLPPATEVAQSFSFRRGLDLPVSSAQVAWRDWSLGRSDARYPHLGGVCREVVFTVAHVNGAAASFQLRLLLAPFVAPGRYHVPSFANEFTLIALDAAGSPVQQWPCEKSYGSVVVHPGGTSGEFDRVRFEKTDGGPRIWLVGSWRLT